jgi:UDP-N-acetylglucosamine 2-epimerase (non-hydrolysing)
VTAHRRENQGPGVERICQALSWLAQRPDVEILFPLHGNPLVRGPVTRRLGRLARIHLLEPLDYLPFIDLLSQCDLVATDSGGLQEEAPALGKPVIVLRENTERPEGIAAGVARLAGTDPARIVHEVCRLLDDPEHYRRMARPLPLYGDGRAVERIAAALLRYAETEASRPKAMYAAAS